MFEVEVASFAKTVTYRVNASDADRAVDKALRQFFLTTRNVKRNHVKARVVSGEFKN